jgi:hypothetical protein
VRFSSTAALLAILAGCGGAGVNRFPLRDPLVRDDDMRPFRRRPASYFSPFLWDGLDMILFRPIARFFAVDPGSEAVNVNALDEVPDSSWFENRLGARPMSTGEMARGSCAVPPLDPVGPWKVIAAKPNGASPGFTIEGEDGLRYLVKFEGVEQPLRASSADVIGSRIYHAAGFNTPCNELMFFRREIVKLAPDAQGEDESGKKTPLTEQAIDDIVKQTSRLPDGRYRAMVSLFLPGEPIGPFRYVAVRDDDRNDVVPHEDRRELRGSYLLAAWIHHFDAREMNTLDTWIEVPGQGGYVRHHILDWGDSLGIVWPWDEMTRRIGHAYYFDFSNMLFDFLTLGVPARPWDRAQYGPAGMVWAYFDIETFDPERYHPGYPNPAFMRMTEHDGAWMARIIAGFTDEHIAALADLAVLPDPVVRSELIRILRGRRDKILARYLGRLSALTLPRLRDSELCVDDVAVAAGVAGRAERRYAARVWMEGADANRSLTVRLDGAAALCVALPPAVGPRRYVIVDVLSYAPHARRQVPLRVHLYDLGEAGARIVGLERPDDDAAPGS